VGDFAEKYGLEIEIYEDFRERKVDSCWIDDFTTFSKKQWEDFDYKLSDGECLGEVQKRNIAALKLVLEKFSGRTVAIAGHGTALSTIINYYDKSFNYKDFERIKNIMPWIVEMHFDEKGTCTYIKEHLL
nr:histidine phosphatase family protein [Treponemataceae bacterium]